MVFFLLVVQVERTLPEDLEEQATVMELLTSVVIYAFQPFFTPYNGWMTGFHLTSTISSNEAMFFVNSCP